MMRVRRSPVVLLVLVAALALSGAAASSVRPDASHTLTKRLARALVAHGVAGSLTAALAVDLRTGETVFARNAMLPLEPASNEKLAVTYAALKALGPSFRFRTDVVGVGRRIGRVWHGSVYLVGKGDPTLTGTDLHELAVRVKAAGIRVVTGSVVGDESYFDRARGVAGWKSSFYSIESAPLSALVVDGAVYRGKVSSVPALAAASRLRAFLRGVNVRVLSRSRTGAAPAGAPPLASHESEPLWRVIREMDTWSDNFVAEMLLKQLGASEAARGTSAAGATVVVRELARAGVPLTGVHIVDGSGLSQLDRMTVSALVGILRAAWAEPALRPLVLQALPVAGRTGTLRHRMLVAPARGVVRAKTGTTDEASALAGYVPGRFVFAILHNGDPVPSWFAAQAQDRFVQLLAAH
jgi:D-alanyl-D-alanine carboxypeptidase/D-alanyl-D-alanine-endopeptidase (penicillin-binding protein 4)